jgi:hypothetical protein
VHDSGRPPSHNGGRGFIAEQESAEQNRCKQIVRYRESPKLMAAERMQRLGIGAREIGTDDDRQL